jgi:O-antigen ligase
VAYSGNLTTAWRPRAASGPVAERWPPVLQRGNALHGAIGRILLFVLLAFALVGTRPFSGTDIDSASSASDGSLNQIVWLAAILLAAPLIMIRFRLAMAIAWRAWPLLLVMAWATATALWSPLPELTLRRVAVLWLMYAAALGVAVSDIPLSEFHRIAMLVVGIVMAVDVLGVIGLPGRAINAEGQFVGMHDHKNSAGQAAVMAALCWYFYAGRYSWSLNRLCILAGSAFFYLLILASGSKTGSALALLVMIWCTSWAILARKGAAVGMIWWSGLGFALLIATVVLIVSGVTATDVGMALFGDLTFTGRWQLWEVIWDQIVQHYWLGYGFGAFWDVNGVDNSLGLAKSVGWLGVVGQAHNGYLDLFLQIGLIGLGLALLSLVWSLRLAHKLLRLTPEHPFDMSARAFAYAMILSIALYNLLESSYLRPHHLQAVWLFLALPIMQRELLESRAAAVRIAAVAQASAKAVSRKPAFRRGPLPLEARREPFL